MMTLLNNNSASILFLCLSLFYLSKPLHAYDPIDRLSINCGSSGNSSDGQRTWTGDISSKLFLSSNKPTQVAQATTQPPSIKPVPYTTARFSYSQFTYSFPLTQGPKFLRLFFNPTSSYSPNFNLSNSFFTVQSGNFTLLKDFNPSLTSEAEKKDTFFKEYIINVDDGQRLNLTFTPNTSLQNSYAFVNGIEIVSMPFDLYYYTAQSGNQGIKLVGTNSSLYNLNNNTALETDYRLNINDNTITPKGDTGLLRIWDGNDYEFLINETSHLSSVDFGGATKLRFTMVPNYTAPDELYRTLRNMGRNGTHNQASNMTWGFDVDAGFNYMIRLHFCELDPFMKTAGERAFFIYINGEVVEDDADVLTWTNGERGVPVYRDYAVPVTGDQNQKANLLLQMHPLPYGETDYHDPFLNGLEIFKTSDTGTHNLAGPNPDPVRAPVQPDPVRNSKDNNSATTIIGIVVGVASGVVLILILSFFILKRRKTKDKESNSTTTKVTSKWGPLSFSTVKSTNTNSSLPSDLCRQFSIVEIRAATSNFNEVFIIGVGGFGHVYKGYIDGGSTPVAIKRLKPGSQQGANEFMNEIHMLSQLRHLHLVSLIGYCNENNEMILVYDFMTRGTLRDHLYNTNNPPLSWKQRLQICIGAAKGLHYLHTGVKHMIIHRDVKTTNILLDEKWVAKVSDFGLSRIGPTGMSKAHVSTVVKGSLGYLDPEYYKRQRLTEKSDVYSFGVVLFEILCARPPLIRTAEKKQESLADWGRHCCNGGTLGQIVDPTLKGGIIAPECLRKFGEVAVSCLHDDGTQRPSMNDIVWMLEFALQLQESAEQRVVAVGMGVIDVDGVGRRDENGDDNMFSGGTIVGRDYDFYNKSSGIMSESVTSSSMGENSYGNKESDRLMSGNVFSEIIDPKPC